MAPGDMAKTRCFTSGYPDESRTQGTNFTNHLVSVTRVDTTWIPIDSLGIVLSSPNDKCRVKWMLNGAVFWVYLPYLEEVQ